MLFICIFNDFRLTEAQRKKGQKSIKYIFCRKFISITVGCPPITEISDPLSNYSRCPKVTLINISTALRNFSNVPNFLHGRGF